MKVRGRRRLRKRSQQTRRKVLTGERERERDFEGKTVNFD